jgi:hypothetical protein
MRCPVFAPKANCLTGLRTHISKTGPPSGQSTTVTYAYEFLDVQPSLDSQDAWISIRGAPKDILAELGGGEVYLRVERNAFRSDRYHKWARVYWDSGKMIPGIQFIAGLDSNIF